jgi:hypothetical protein
VGVPIDTAFSGRFVHVAETADWDASLRARVQGLSLALQQLGLRSEVLEAGAEWPACETDVVVLHHAGRSGPALQRATQTYTTRVLCCHHLDEADPALVAALGAFHRIWTCSPRVHDELLALGVDSARLDAVRTVIDAPQAGPSVRRAGTWLCLGPIEPEQHLLELVRLFEQTRRVAPLSAQELVFGITGRRDIHYERELTALVAQLGLSAQVWFDGPLATATARAGLIRSAEVCVSLASTHTDQTLLMEAALGDVPVVSLDDSLWNETNPGALVATTRMSEVPDLVRRAREDAAWRHELLASQARVARRHTLAAVAHDLKPTLAKLLPAAGRFARVSVVICTYNRWALLERLLDRLQHQDNPGFEVIVVNGPSSDRSAELLATRAHLLKVADNPHRNLALSRNIGIGLADGDIVAFLDDDALPFDNWVGTLLAAYNARPLSTAGLGGPAYYAGTLRFQAEDNAVNRLAEVRSDVASLRLGPDEWMRYNTGTNASFTTAALRAVGGFDPQYDYYLDETDVCLRLQRSGHLIGYVPELLVRHEFAQSPSRRGRMDFDWYTICKNTAYFAAVHSGLQEHAVAKVVEQRIQEERLDTFEHAHNVGVLTTEERYRFGAAARAGARQGLLDAQRGPRKGQLTPAPGRYKPYPVAASAAPVRPGERAHLHVCIIAREFPQFAGNGGVGTMFYHLASELLLMGHRISLIVPGDPSQTLVQGPFRVYHVRPTDMPQLGGPPDWARNVAWSVAALEQLSRIDAAEPVDIVESCLWDAEGLAVALLPRHSRPPVVVRLVTPFALASRINGWQPDHLSAELFGGAEKALLEAADAVVPISEAIATSVEEIHQLARDDRWCTIPCGVAPWPHFDVNHGYNEFPALKGLPLPTAGPAKLVVFLGRLERRKGIDLLLEAAVTILAADPQAHVVIAGRDVDGWAARERAPGCEQRVHFVGEVDNATKDKLLAHAYCLVFPSRYESFGLVPLEGFVHGVPVVAARVGAIPEVVEDGLSGLLFEAGSASDLARCVQRLLEDSALRAVLSAGASRRARTLDSRLMASRSVALYRALLVGQPTPS